jgi:hypothetical protein
MSNRSRVLATETRRQRQTDIDMTQKQKGMVLEEMPVIFEGAAFVHPRRSKEEKKLRKERWGEIENLRVVGGAQQGRRRHLVNLVVIASFVGLVAEEMDFLVTLHEVANIAGSPHTLILVP